MRHSKFRSTLQVNWSLAAMTVHYLIRGEYSQCHYRLRHKDGVYIFICELKCKSSVYYMWRWYKIMALNIIVSAMQQTGCLWYVHRVWRFDTNLLSSKSPETGSEWSRGLMTWHCQRSRSDRSPIIVIHGCWSTQSPLDIAWGMLDPSLSFHTLHLEVDTHTQNCREIAVFAVILPLRAHFNGRTLCLLSWYALGSVGIVLITCGFALCPWWVYPPNLVSELANVKG